MIKIIKCLLFYASLLFIAVYLGSKFASHPGYVLFSYQNWSVEISLWFAVLALLLILFIFYGLIKILDSPHAILQNWRIWALCRKAAKFRRLARQAQQGFVALINEDRPCLKSLLPGLRKAKILSSGELAKLDALFLLDYYENLIKTEQYDEVEQLLRRTLKKQWEPRLLAYYGRVKSNKPLKQLALAKSWLQDHENDPNLLLCLGRLSARHSLWGQARDYLQASIRAGGGAEAYYELAKVLEQLGEQAAALVKYKEALSQLLA